MSEQYLKSYSPQEIDTALRPALVLDAVASYIPKNTVGTRPVIINIAGASGSGKSTLAGRLSAGLRDSQVFGMDRYLIGRTRIRSLKHDGDQAGNPYLAGLNPEAFQPSKMLEDIEEIKKGKKIRIPVYNKQTNEPEGDEVFEPSQFILVEGLLALEPNFRRVADITVLVDATTHDRVIRKIIRNKLDYKRDDINWTIRNYLENEEPTYRLYIPRYRRIADVTVRNNTKPHVYFNKYPSEQTTFLSDSEIRTLIPQEQTGELGDGERVSVLHLGESSYIVYEVNGKVLFQSELDDMVLKALSCYYAAYKLEG